MCRRAGIGDKRGASAMKGLAWRRLGDFKTPGAPLLVVRYSQ